MNVISPATAAAFAAGLYFAAVMAARAARWSPVDAHPILAGAVLLIYVVIVVGATRRAGVVRRLAAFITLVVLHVAIVSATAYVWALATDTPFASTLRDAVWAFPTAAILQVLCVPVMAWPLRRLFAPPSIARAVPARTRRGVAPLPKAQPVPWPLAAPLPAPARVVDTLSVEAPVGLSPAAPVDVVARAPVDETSSGRESVVAAAGATVMEAPAAQDSEIPSVERGVPQIERTTAQKMAPREIEKPRATNGAEDPRVRAEIVMPTTDVNGHAGGGPMPPAMVNTMPAGTRAPGGDGTASVRIRFEAVADQIPHGVLTASAVKIAAQLPDPGYVLVPEALVVSQLAEGLVRVGWEVIGRQLPDAAFAGTRAAIAARLADVAIELPLGDVVSQLSPDVFVDALGPVDVTGLESFPMPFQPSTETLATVDATVTPASAEPERPGDPPVLAVSDAVPVAPPVEEPVPVPDASEPDATLLADELDDESRLDAVVPDPVDIEPVAVDAEPTPQISVVAGPPDVSVPSEPVVLPPVAPREIRALFARLNRFEIDAEMVDGVTLYRVVGPDMSAEALREVATHLLSPLRRGWSRRGLDQITVRGATAAVVVTALGDLDGTGAVLVAGTRRGPGLALVELLGRRGAAEWPSAGRSVAAPTMPVPDGPALGHVDGDGLGWIARALAAFGSVGGRRFAGDGAVVYAFVHPSLVAPDVAAFAREVIDAVTSAGVADLGPLESVTARRGAEQVVIRALARPLGVARLVVAAGAVDRPGLAHRQVERAAVLLAAETV